ncbi:MAG: DNA polymerase III subunit gamma/tau [Candidatus Muiribacteriaceae bacterium]
MNLYRKYRPQNFSDMVGQEFAVQTVKNSIISNRISHAYIFSGPRGTGKTSLAKIFGKAVNCLDESSFEPCNRCKNCMDFNEGRFLDYYEIDAASKGKVDEMRDLIDKVGYVPSQGKYKIYVLDEAHMLTTGASNAFLKTLEEPPGHVIFILATTEPHKILNTIKSRCQFFEFHRIDNRKIRQRLQVVCEKENISITDGALEYVSYYAEGGMRDALSILDQLWSFSGAQITEDTVSEVFGTAGHDIVFEFLETFRERDFKKILDFTESMYEKGTDFIIFSEDLLKVLKDIIYIKWNAASAEIIPFYSRFSDKISRLDIGELLGVLNTMNSIYYVIKKSSDPRLCFELTFFELLSEKKSVQKTETAHVKSGKGTADLKEKVQMNRQKNTGKKNVDKVMINNALHLLTEKIEKKSLFLSSCIKACEQIFDEKTMTVAFVFESNQEFLYIHTDKKKKLLADGLHDITGTDINVDINIKVPDKTEESGASEDTGQSGPVQETSEVSGKKDPDMQNLIDNNDMLKKITSKLNVKSIKKI